MWPTSRCNLPSFDLLEVQGSSAEHFAAPFAGSAITGPIGKECADLWPRIASAANAIV